MRTFVRIVRVLMREGGSMRTYVRIVRMCVGLSDFGVNAHICAHLVPLNLRAQRENFSVFT